MNTLEEPLSEFSSPGLSLYAHSHTSMEHGIFQRRIVIVAAYYATVPMAVSITPDINATDVSTLIEHPENIS